VSLNCLSYSNYLFPQHIKLWLATIYPMKHGLSSSPYYLLNQQHHEPWAEHRMIINGMFWGLCSGAPWRDLPERYGPWKTVYNRFNRWSKSGLINIIFHKLLSSLDAYGLVDWSATELDGSNIRALRCDVGAQKNIPISPEITAWVALAVVLAPKSIWLQTEVASR
jgi:transposase